MPPNTPTKAGGREQLGVRVGGCASLGRERLSRGAPRKENEAVRMPRPYHKTAQKSAYVVETGQILLGDILQSGQKVIPSLGPPIRLRVGFDALARGNCGVAAGAVVPPPEGPQNVFVAKGGGGSGVVTHCGQHM